MKHAIVFDFDGTLIDSNLIKYSLFLSIAQSFDQLENMKSILAANPYLSRHEVFKIFCSSFKCSEEASILVDHFSRECDLRLKEAPEIPGALNLLNYLHNSGKKLFINSATPIENLIPVLTYKSLDKYFCKVYGACESKILNLHNLMQEYCLIPSNITVVGDSENDRLSAEYYNIDYIGLFHESSDYTKVPIYRCSTLIDSVNTFYPLLA